MTAQPRSLPAEFDLSGRVAIVTGSSHGIGLGIALRLSEAGAAVMCNARTGTTGTTAELEAQRGRYVHEAPMRFHASDVSTVAGAEGLVAATLLEFGRLDIVVNNAGLQPAGAGPTPTARLGTR